MTDREPTTVFDERFIRKLEYWSLVFKRLYGGELSASRRSKEVGSGIEFADRRVYLPGDDYRYIDWKALGRFDRALVRLFLEEKDLRVSLLIDSSASMGVGSPPKLETAVRLAAVLAYIVLVNLDRVSLTIFSAGVDEHVPPARGRARIRKVLDLLGGVRAGGRTDLARAAREVAGRSSKKGLFVVLSDLLVGEGFDECVRRLAYEGSEVSVVRVLAREDRSPPVRGDVEIVDAETGERLRLTATPGLVARYERSFAAMSRTLEETAMKRGARFVTVTSADPFDDQVFAVLRSMGKRK